MLLQDKKIIALLYGGKSGEHEVSLESAASVLSALDTDQYHIKLIGITKEGKWYLQNPELIDEVRSGKPLKIERQNEVLGSPGQGLLLDGKPLLVDLVFPVVHGTNLEDGILQGYLETLELAYVGSTVLGSAVSFDKDLVKKLWNYDGIATVPHICIYAKEYEKSGANDIWDEMLMLSESPYFIKPARGGSSVGVSKVHSRDELEPALKHAFSFDEKIIIEKGIIGREIECSVVGNFEPRAFSPGEISASHEFYDYEAKYIDENGAKLLVPAPLDQDIADQIKNLAIRAFRCAEAKGFARVDFFFDEENNSVLVNEINTIPGFTKISMFPRMCAGDGLEYPKLLDELVTLALEDKKRKSSLLYSRA